MTGANGDSFHMLTHALTTALNEFRLSSHYATRFVAHDAASGEPCRRAESQISATALMRGIVRPPGVSVEGLVRTVT